jgi:hypothetical protein
MARHVVINNANNMTTAKCPITAYPWTQAAWFFADDTTSAGVLFELDTSTAPSDSFSGILINDSGFAGKVCFQVINSANTFGTEFSSPLYPVGRWNHACGVALSSTTNYLYLNGRDKQSITTNNVPISSDFNRMEMGGSFYGGAAALAYNGAMAHAALWNVDLTDAEIFRLGQGLAPPFIRPQNLVGYWPLYGMQSPEVDLSPKANHMTLHGTVTYHDGPRILTPRPWWARPFAKPAVGLYIRPVIAYSDLFVDESFP